MQESVSLIPKSHMEVTQFIQFFYEKIWTVYGNIYLLAHNNKFCNLLNEYILLDFDLCLYLLIPFQL